MLSPKAWKLYPQVLQLLLSSTEAEEECRGVVAECLGRLALLSPAAVLPPLLAAAAAPSAATRVTAVTAAKHMVLDAPHSVDAQLQAALPGFLKGLEDSDRCTAALNPSQTDLITDF